MKIRLRPGATYKRLDPSEEYLVLELLGPAFESAMLARIHDGDSSNELVEIAHFEVVDAHIPSNWRVRFGSASGHSTNWLVMAPEPWLRPGFWEDFFGERFDEHPGTLDAQAEYARELQVMLAEVG